LSRFQCALAARKLTHLAKINRARKAKANLYRRSLEGIPGLRIPRTLDGADPAYLRFPVLVNPRQRDQLVDLMHRAGLGASSMYPEPVDRIEGIGPHLAGEAAPLSGASEVAETLITLPTHHYVSDHEVLVASQRLREYLKSD